MTHFFDRLKTKPHAELLIRLRENKINGSKAKQAVRAELLRRELIDSTGELTPKGHVALMRKLAG